MSTKIWDKEPKNLGLRYNRKAMEGYSLSGVVIVFDEVIKTVTISYNPRAISIIGARMPYGVGPAHPAYLRVEKITDDRYEVSCCYKDIDRPQVLWFSKELPLWCKQARRVNREQKT